MCNDVWASLINVMLKPVFDVGTDELSAFWAISVSYNRTERAGDTVA